MRSEHPSTTEPAPDPRHSQLRGSRAARGRIVRWALIVGIGLFTLAFGNRLLPRSPDPNRLLFSHTYTTESEREIIAAVVKEFESSHPGIRIEQTVANSEVYQNVGWRLQFRGKNPPDIFFHWRGYKVDTSARRGWAMDLRPLLDPSFLARFVGAAFPPAPEPIHFLPQSIDVSNVVWYNADDFQRLGLRPPETFEEWLEVCRKLRAAGRLPLVQGNRDLWPMGNSAAELFGQSVGAEGLRRLFDPEKATEPAAFEPLSSFEILKKEGAFDLAGVLSPDGIASLGDIDAKVMFLSGKASQHIIGSWFLADIQDASSRKELHFPVKFFPIPPRRGETDAMTAVMTGFLVNPRSRNPKAAVEFLQLLLSRKYQEQFAAIGNLSLRRDAPEFISDPVAKELLAVLAKTPAVVPPPDTGFATPYATAFYEIVGKVLSGDLAVADASAVWNRDKESLRRKGL